MISAGAMVDYVGQAGDSIEHQRARLAWTQLWMFPKTSLAALPGGHSKRKRNRNILANRLDRWALGERRALWDETLAAARPSSTHCQMTRRRGNATSGPLLPSLGRDCQERLSNALLAPPTPAFETAMRAKFPPPPPHQHTTTRPCPAPASELEAEVVLQAIRAFPRGSAAGPSGLRADFLQQLVGSTGDHAASAGITLLTSFANMLADGRAPRGLRAYLGGAKGTALAKLNKTTGEEDVRVHGRGVSPRLVGKALLKIELPALRTHLLPHLLAVGVPAGAEAS